MDRFCPGFSSHPLVFLAIPTPAAFARLLQLLCLRSHPGHVPAQPARLVCQSFGLVPGDFLGSAIRLARSGVLWLPSTAFSRETGRLFRGNYAARHPGDIYHYIRHPLYASLLYLAWGIFFKSPSLLDGCIAAVATAFLYATARADENECLVKFGGEYAEYMKATKMFIPFIL
jgi:hypothetical protein